MRAPETVMGALIVSMSLIGAYALRNDMADVMYMAIFGIAGFFMRRYDLPMPPLVLGVILGPLAERYFLTAMIGSGNNWTIFFTRPITLGLILASVLILALPVWQQYRRKKGDKSALAA